MWIWQTLLGLGASLLGRRGAIGSAVSGITKDLLEAYLELENAESAVEIERIKARIARLKAIESIQSQVARRRFSPVVIGQFLIVIPFGLWWAAIYGVSVLNGIFGWNYKVLDVPQHITEMAWWLIPAIVVGTVFDRKLR